MNKLILLTSILILSINGWSQNKFDISSIAPSDDLENIEVKKLSSSEEATSFVIWVKKSVKAHKHNHHTEHVYIVEGNGIFYLDGKTMEVKAGDWIYIPKGAVHAVKTTSKSPMKVVSVQSPQFLGKDREFIENLKW